MRRFLLVVVLIVFPPLPAQSSEPLRLLEPCDATAACLRMYLYYEEARPPLKPGDFDALISQVIPLNAEWTDYELTVEGRLNGAAVRHHKVLFRAYTDGLACSRFGQGFVSVTGFSSAGKPLLLTNAGEIEITKAPKLEVGCQDCLRLLDSRTKQPVAKYATPAWDLTLVGHRRADFRYNASGEAFLLDGERCIRLATADRFVIVDSKNCMAPMSEVGHFGRPAYGISPAPAEWLFENPETDYLMFLASGACT